jgi:hypothetical protein
VQGLIIMKMDAMGSLIVKVFRKLAWLKVIILIVFIAMLMPILYYVFLVLWGSMIPSFGQQ